MPNVQNMVESVLSRRKRGTIFPDGETNESLAELFESPTRWVALGCVLVVILMILLVCCVCWCRNRKHTDKVTDSVRAPFVPVHTLHNNVYLPTTEPLVGCNKNSQPANPV